MGGCDGGDIAVRRGEALARLASRNGKFGIVASSIGIEGEDSALEQRKYRVEHGGELLLASAIRQRADAVRMGAGVARLPISLVSHDLAAGRLAHWGDAEGSEIALLALYPSRRLLSTRVSAFLDHLRAAFPDGTPEELARYVEKG